MRFRFFDIGPIKTAELEIGDLTIIAGRNNTGKTYLAYSLYGFLKSWRGWPGAAAVLLEPPPEAADGSGAPDWSGLRAMAAAFDRDGEAQRDVDRETLARERAPFADAFGRSFSQTQLAQVFNSPPGAFERARVEPDFGADFPASVPSIRIDIGRGATASIGYDGGRITVSRTGEWNPVVPGSLIAFARLYYRLLMAGLPDPFILSSERFGISLFYKDLDSTRSQLVELLQKLGDSDEGKRVSPWLLIDRSTSRYALPIKDNIDYTRGVSDIASQRSEIHETRLFQEIKDMMEGYYTASADEIRFVSKRRKDAGFNIPLHLASSSARGLSDLYFFLRHAARRNHILIVDEPESHLDPANQIGLAHLLSKIVRAGIRVLVTTHSDYLVKEINNLIMLDRLEAEGRASEFGYPAGVSLNPQRVRAYNATGGGLDRCEIDACGIGMPVFDTTIDRINEASWKLAAGVARVEEPAV